MAESMNQTQGILYVAYGDLAREACTRSIATARAFLPDFPVAVVSDAPLPDVEHVHVRRPEADVGARTWKTQIYALSPFDETLFLDADTECVSSPQAGFDLLRLVDVVLVQDCDRRVCERHHANHDPEERTATLAEIGADGDLLYYNSGVIFFKRNARTLNLFTAWYTEWQRWRKHDQLAFARALYRNPVRIGTMRESWNTHRRNQARFVWHNHRSVGRQGAPR
jgi:hypothetical protein